MLNASEIQYLTNHGRYATLDELVTSGLLSNILNGPGAWNGLHFDLHNLQQPLPDYRLTLLVSLDRRQYLISLVGIGPTDCAVSFFSNESELVWHGRNLQCPIDTTPTANPQQP